MIDSIKNQKPVPLKYVVLCNRNFIAGTELRGVPAGNGRILVTHSNGNPMPYYITETLSVLQRVI